MSPATAKMLVDEILPRIQSAVPRCVKPVGSEDGDELVQDATATAAQMLEACEANGRPIYPASVAFYAIQRGKSGRRSYGATRTDVLCASAQLDGHSTLSSMDEPIASDDDNEGFTLHDVLGNNEEDPSSLSDLARPPQMSYLNPAFARHDLGIKAHGTVVIMLHIYLMYNILHTYEYAISFS